MLPLPPLLLLLLTSPVLKEGVDGAADASIDSVGCFPCCCCCCAAAAAFSRACNSLIVSGWHSFLWLSGLKPATKCDSSTRMPSEPTSRETVLLLLPTMSLGPGREGRGGEEKEEEEVAAA